MSGATHRFRCGDVARAEGEDFDIEVAYADYGTGYASWCGWPEGCVEIARLRLVSACTDDQHRAAVARWLVGQGPQSRDHRPDAVERLYRPRAYWRRLLERERERLIEQATHVARLASELAKAEAGPDDAGAHESQRAREAVPS